MTREEAIDLLDNLIGMIEDNHNSDYDTAFRMAIKALEQEPCGDAISRQAVLEQTYLWSKDEFLRVTNPFDYLRKKINSLPPINPQEPKTGHWIEVTNGRGGHECNICHAYAPSYQSGDEYLTNYCPNCGAKMIEPQESEEISDTNLKMWEELFKAERSDKE